MENKIFNNKINRKLVIFVIFASMVIAPLAAIPITNSAPAGDDLFLYNTHLPTEKILTNPVKQAVSGTTEIIAGANYLIHTQADVTNDNAGNGADPGDLDPDDGGWDWVSTIFTHSAAASPVNIYGATAQGLYYAYRATQLNSLTPDPRYMIAMKDAADKMVANANIRSASDLIFLMLYDDLPSVCGTIYQAAAKAKYDARITTYGSATLLAQWIRDTRNSQGYDNGIIAWDISAWVKAAAMLDARYGGYAADADAMAEVLYQDSFGLNPGYFDALTPGSGGVGGDQGYDPAYGYTDYYWYTSGITGLIDSFDAAQVHTSDITTTLLPILLACQCPSGGFSYQYGGTPGDEDWQMTAYAVMTLGDLNAYTYQTQIQAACAWIISTQDPISGGWVYSSGNHYPEVGGENLAALYFTGTVFNIDTGEVFWSIEAAIDDLDTVNGNTIEVQPGTYKGNIIVYKEVTIQSSAGNATTIIDASQIDVCNYKNAWCKGISYTWALTYSPGLLKNGFDIWSDNVVIDGFKVINALWPTEYNKGIGILIGSIHTTYAGFIPWNIDQWGGLISPVDEPTPAGVIIKHNYIDGASDGIYNWASSGNIIEGNTVVNSVAVGGAGVQCYEGGTDNIIRGNAIDNCDGAGISVGGAWMPNPADGLLDISNTKIYNNQITLCGIGIQFYNADGSGTAAYNNKILNNNRGIYVGDAYGGTTVATAYCNDIVGNTNGVINNAVAGPFNAECNWWGDHSGPGTVGSGIGDTVSTNVDYDPWIGQVVAEAGGPYTSYGLVTFAGSAAQISFCCSEVLTIIGYSWDFGDGNFGTGAAPTHYYPINTTYTVTLIVTVSIHGQTFTVTDTALVTIIHVPCPPDNNTPVIDLMRPEPNTQVSGTTEIYWLAYIPANELSTDFYVDLYYSPDGITWRVIAVDLQNQFPDDPVHGHYMWDTTQLSDEDYWIKGEAWTLERDGFTSDILTATVYVYNGNAGGMVSDIQIIDVSTNSKKWVKDTDAVTITAGITGATGFEKNDIIADLTSLGGGAAVPADAFDGFVATWNLDNVVCSPSNGPITITVTVLAEDGGSKTCTITADNIKPEASLVKPVNGLYLFGAKILPLMKTIIIGSATVQLSAQDATSGIQKAELYLNENLVGETLSAPYIIGLNKQYKGVAELTIQVYDNAGNIEEIIQPVTIYNFFGN